MVKPQNFTAEFHFASKRIASIGADDTPEVPSLVGSLRSAWFLAWMGGTVP
jgi:hypothetical protein